MQIKFLTFITFIFLYSSCKKSVTGEYSGTASVTEGLATTTTENLYANGIRVAGVGTITATDNSVWTFLQK